MGDRPFLYASIASIATIVLMTEFGLFRRILDTTNLDLEQWVVCILVGLLIIPVSEVRKLLVKKPIDEVPADAIPAAPVGCLTGRKERSPWPTRAPRSCASSSSR